MNSELFNINKIIYLGHMRCFVLFKVAQLFGKIAASRFIAKQTLLKIRNE